MLGSPGACRVVRESLTAEVDLGRRTLTRTRLPCARLSDAPSLRRARLSDASYEPAAVR